MNTIYTVAGIPYSAELYHYGIKGQKWGIRRFQNPDKSLTEAGRKRYGSGKSDSDPKSSRKSGMSEEKRAKLKKVAKGVAIGVGTAAAAYGAYKLAQNTGYLERVTNNAARVKDSTFAFKMTDKELVEKIGRLAKEKELRRMTYDAIVNPASPTERMFIESGRKIAGAALTGMGTYAAFALLNKKFDLKEAARYSFSNPNKKKN